MQPDAADGQLREGVLADLAGVLRRRWRVILATVVLFTLVAAVRSISQPAEYKAFAEVLIARQNIANALTGTQDPSVYAQDDRLGRTQAAIAQNPDLAKAALKSIGRSVAEYPTLFADSGVDLEPNTDVLAFTVQGGNPELAQKLATAWATQFSDYRRKLDTDPIVQARREVEARLSRLRGQRSGLVSNLEDKAQQLRTLQTLQTSNARVVRRAAPAEQVAPRPRRAVLFALFLGLTAGVLLALLRDALDNRVRDSDGASAALGLSLLARLPSPPQGNVKGPQLFVESHPHGAYPEAVRMLRASVEAQDGSEDLRTILITSALEGEGKSTTAANLAFTYARTGRRVLLMDVDFRRPTLHRPFGVEARPGLADVLLGRRDVHDAVSRVSLNRRARGQRTVASGSLDVLPAGFSPADPGEVFASDEFALLLREVSSEWDIVLLDTAPILAVGDTVSLSSHVDGMIVLVSMAKAKRRVLAELRRVMMRSGGRKLGFATTSDDVAVDRYGYGYGYGAENEDSDPRPERETVQPSVAGS